MALAPLLLVFGLTIVFTPPWHTQVLIFVMASMFSVPLLVDTMESYPPLRQWFLPFAMSSHH